MRRCNTSLPSLLKRLWVSDKSKVGLKGCWDTSGTKGNFLIMSTVRDRFWSHGVQASKQATDRITQHVPVCAFLFPPLFSLRLCVRTKCLSWGGRRQSYGGCGKGGGGHGMRSGSLSFITYPICGSGGGTLGMGPRTDRDSRRASFEIIVTMHIRGDFYVPVLVTWAC